MVKIKVTVQLQLESGLGGRSWELEESKVMQLMEWLLGAPTLPTPMGSSASDGLSRSHAETPAPQARVIDLLDAAYAKLGKRVVTSAELARQMLADGWVTRSKAPTSVVSSALRDESGRTYEKRGEGWTRIQGAQVKASSTGSITGLRKPIGPGLKVLIRQHLETHGPSSVAELRTAILAEYPEASPESIGSGAQEMARLGKIVRTGEGLYSLP